jgi:ribose-phosphate pyrophosphokinase
MSAGMREERTEETISLQVLTTDGQEVAGLVTPPAIVSGSANEPLAQAIAARLNTELLARRIERFPDGELYVRFESSVRGRDAYIIQPTCAPVNEHLFELLLLIDTLRRASAGRITAIIPYYGYARQDRKFTGRDPITAKLVANLIAAAGATRVLAVDLHSPAIQGFFDIGMDHLSAIQLLAEDLKGRIPINSVIVSPDTGGVKRADIYARLLDLPIAILHKRRAGPHDVEIGAVIGDIRDKYPIVVDDMITTGGTVRKAVDTLILAGARPQVRVVATHAVLAGEASTLLRHPALLEIVVTDTVPVPAAVRAALPQLRVVSVADLLAHAILRLHSGLSLSALFNRDGAPPI